MIKKLIITLISFAIPFSIAASNKLSFMENSNDIKTISDVVHQKISGNSTNDNGGVSNQNINIFTQGDDIEVVSWSKFTGGKVSLATTIDIAKDFESVNPNFEVVAGVNGDYFYNDQTTNANVIYGNRVINHENHFKYNSVEFNLNGSYVKEHKQIVLNDTLTMDIYDQKFNQVMSKTEIKEMNKYSLNDGEISYIDGSRHQYSESNSYFELSGVKFYSKAKHTFVEAIIGNKTSDIKNKKVLASNNKDIDKLLKNGSRIVIRNEVLKSNSNSMVIGVDNKIINKGVVPSFDDLKGQNDDNNKNRHPRTGFGYNEQGKMMLFTVDGRDMSGSKGVNLREFGNIMSNYGVKDGFNLDGGGSTQAILKENGKFDYVNNPSDGPLNIKNPNYRTVANALLFVKRVEKPLTPKLIQDENSSEIEFDLPKTNGLVNYKIFINNEWITYKAEDLIGKFKITLDEVKYNAVSIVATKIIDNKEVEILLYNEVFSKDLNGPEEPIENATVKISHEYEKNILKVNIEYDDPNKTIDKIRVYLKDPEIDKPAMVQNMSNKQATFELDKKLKSQTINVEISYKDGTIDNVDYNIENVSVFKISVIITVSIILVFIGIIITYLIIKRKR